MAFKYQIKQTGFLPEMKTDNLMNHCLKYQLGTIKQVTLNYTEFQEESPSSTEKVNSTPWISMSSLWVSV